MFNITNSVRLLLDAEQIKASRHLANDEKITLLVALRDSVNVMPGLPAHMLAVRQSLGRMVEDETKDNERAPAKPAPAKQGRKAKGVKEPAEVASGRTEEATEAAPRPTEGVSGEAEDAGRADNSGSAAQTAKAS